MAKTNIVYGVGKRTSASSTAARHIDDGMGKPLCQHKTKTGRGIGSGYVQDFDEPTCKRCLKLAAPADPPPAASEPTLNIFAPNPSPQPGAFRAARGIFAPADEPAEVSIRRLRDAAPSPVAGEAAPTVCPRCGGDEWVDATGFATGRVPCPECQDPHGLKRITELERQLAETDDALDVSVQAGGLLAMQLTTEKNLHALTHSQLADARKDTSEWKRIADGVVADHEKLFAERKDATARAERAEAYAAQVRAGNEEIGAMVVALAVALEMPHPELSAPDKVLARFKERYTALEAAAQAVMKFVELSERQQTDLRTLSAYTENQVRFLLSRNGATSDFSPQNEDTLVNALHALAKALHPDAD